MANWRDGTSATREAWQVEAACANIVHATQHLPGGADDLYANGGWDDSLGRYTIFPKIANTGTVVLTSQLQGFTLFQARRTMTFTQIVCCNRGTAGVGGTLARVGLCTVDGSGNMVVVARTATDATMFNTTFQTMVRSIDTTGGFPASYQIVRGSLYAFTYIWVGSGTAPNASGCSGSNSLASASGGYSWCRSRAGLADLADATNAQASGTPGNTLWAELIP